MHAIKVHRTLIAALAAASLAAFGAIGCGSDDDSDGDPAAEPGTETTLQAGTTTTETAEEAEGVFLSYRLAGSGAAPGQLGLVIDDEGRGSYSIGQGREIAFELSPDELAGLRRTFERIRFADLPGRIEPRAGEAVAGPTEVEVGHDGKVVREVPGSANSPLAPIHTAVAEILSNHAVQSGTLSPAKPAN